MPSGSNRIIRFCGWWLEFFGTKLYVFPHTWAKGGVQFFWTDVFADGTFLYQFEIRICIKKREDHFVSPNSLFLAACVGKLYEFVLYNSYKNCLNWYKNHAVYEFVLYNLYNNCMNWYKNHTVYEFVLYNL